MANPTFERPSQGHLRGFEFLTKVDHPFTSQEFAESSSLLPNTACSYLRSFCKAGILEVSRQHPKNVYALKDGWEKTVAAERLQAAYHYN